VEGFGVEGRAVEVEASGEFCGEVLCVGGAASVAAEMDFAAAAQRLGDDLRCTLNAAQKIIIVQHRLLHGDGLLDGLGDAGIIVHSAKIQKFQIQIRIKFVFLQTINK